MGDGADFGDSAGETLFFTQIKEAADGCNAHGSAVGEGGFGVLGIVLAFDMGGKRGLGTRSQEIYLKAVHRADPLKQIISKNFRRRHCARLEKRIEDDKSLRGIVGIVAGLEVAGHDVVGRTVKEVLDPSEASANLFAGPEFTRNAERVTEHHAGKRAGNAV